VYPLSHHQLDWDVEVPDGEVRIISDRGRDFIMLDLVSTSRVSMSKLNLLRENPRFPVPDPDKYGPFR
jgi:hypothetical protein